MQISVEKSKIIINSNNRNLHTNIRYIVLSIEYILTYGCEYWNISALSTKIQGFKNKTHRKLFGITYTEMKTHEYIKDVIIRLIGIKMVRSYNYT